MDVYTVTYICDDLDTHIWHVRMTPEQAEEVERQLNALKFSDAYVGKTEEPSTYEEFIADIGWEDDEAAVPAGD